MTEFIKKKEVKKNWYKIDATNLIVGRLASEITKILRGKKKTSFTPNMDDGDFVIVTNAKKIKFTNILDFQVELRKQHQIKFLRRTRLELLN
jgi:large subunit ribosomal protein L13